MSGLNIIDIIILVIFLSSALVGFGRGFVSEFISLGTLIVAFIVAALFANKLAAYLMSSPSIQSLVTQTTSSTGVDTTQSISYIAVGISFFILFAGTALVGTILGYILNAAFQVTFMGLGNRIFGGIFGLIRGFLINLVLIFLIQLSPFGEQALWKESRMVRAYQPAVQWLANIVSPALSNIKERFSKQLQDVSEKIKGYSFN